jgi:hypothetical protein
MTDKTDEAHKHDAEILDLAARLLDTATGLDFAAKAGMIEEYNFHMLQSQLQDMYRDAGRIASRLQGK